MASFNLTAELNLRGPSNLNQVVSNIRRQLSTISLDLNINPATSRGIQAVTSDVRNLGAALRDAQANAVALSTTLRGLGASASNVARATSNLGSNLGTISGSANNTATAIKAASSEMSEFGRQSALAIRRFAAFSVATGAVYALSRAVSSAYGEFVNFNKEFVRLQQVTDSTASGLTSLSNEITRLSSSLGVSSQELLQVSVTLAQAGLSAGETKTALEALAKSALAPSFDSLNDTVEGSIALMRQFGISAADLESSLGSVNAVAAKFAVEASDIIAAIQRTGGVFANASKGVSEGKDALNEFLAVFTSVRATTRESAETIATGLRTIFTRIQRTDTIDALKQYGISLTDLEGKFVGPFEAVRRLSEGLKALDPRDLRFSSIVEELGGFRQIGKVIPLIQQFESAQKALGVAQRGTGSLAADAATAQEALSVRINKVREQFVALIRDIGQSQGFQTFVDISLKLASALISVADAAKDVLPAIAAIGAIRGFGALGQFFGGFSGGLSRNRPRGFAKGGYVPGSGNRDTVSAMLTPGEFVIRKKAVEKIGVGNLARLNRNNGGPIPTQQFNDGGEVQRFMAGKFVMPKARGKKGAKGYRGPSGFKPLSAEEYKRWAEPIYDQYDRDPSLPWGSYMGIPMPPPIVDYSKRVRDYSLVSGAGLALGKDAKGFEVIAKFGKAKAKKAMSEGKLKKTQGALTFSAAGLKRGPKAPPGQMEKALAAYEKNPEYRKIMGLDSGVKGGLLKQFEAQAKQKIFISPKPILDNIPDAKSRLQNFRTSLQETLRETTDPKDIKSLNDQIRKASTAIDDIDEYMKGSVPANAGRASHFAWAMRQGIPESSMFAKGGAVRKYMAGSPGGVQSLTDEELLKLLKGSGVARTIAGISRPVTADELYGVDPNKRGTKLKNLSRAIGIPIDQLQRAAKVINREKFENKKLTTQEKSKKSLEKNLKLQQADLNNQILDFGLVGLRYGSSSKSKDYKSVSTFNVKKPKGFKSEKFANVRETGSGQLIRVNSATVGEKLGASQAKNLQNILLKSFEKSVEEVAKKMAAKTQTGIDKASSVTKAVENSDFYNIVGTGLESALGLLGAPLFPKTEKTKSIDFPKGLGNAAGIFGAEFANMPTDVTRTIGGEGKGIASYKQQIERWLQTPEGQKRLTKFQASRAYATGGSVQDTVPALLTPGEFVINKKAAKSIGSARLNRLNKADKIQGFNKGGPVGSVQSFATGGSALPARPTNATPFNMVIPPNTAQALQEIARALENMGVSASEAAMLLERGGAISVEASERAFQADVNRLRIAGASAGDIYNAEQRLAQVREENARQINTSRQLTGLTGGQLQDIQTGAELGQRRIIENRRAVMQSRGRSADEIAAAIADPEFQDYARRTAFERSTAAVTGRSTRDLQSAGIGGQDIEAYVNRSSMDFSTLKQMDQQLLETRRQQLRNDASYTSASAAQQRRMMRELKARTNEEIAERRNIINQLRKDRGLSAGFLGRQGQGISRILGTAQTGMALLGMGELRDDAFGQSSRARRFTGGFKRFSAGMQGAGMGLTFAGGMIGDTVGKAVGGKEGQAISSAVSAFVGSAGIGMMFGPIGALTGVVVGATTAIQAWKDSIIEATLQEEAEKIEVAQQKVNKSFERISKSKDPQEANAALKAAAMEFQKISISESKRQKAVADKTLQEPGFFGSVYEFFAGDQSGARMAQAEKEIISSSRQTNILQSLPQQFELGIEKGLSLEQIQASFPPGELDRLKEIFATASGDTVLTGLVAKREQMEKRRREGEQGIDTTQIDAAIKNISNRIFNEEFLKGLQDRTKAEAATAAAAAAATLEINLLGQALAKISSAASKAGAQFEEAQRQIEMQKSIMFGGGQIQGPDRSQENVLENVLSYSFQEIRNVIAKIGSDYQFNPAITREAQDAAVSQKILQQELPRILAEVRAREGEGFNPEGASADVIKKKLEEVFSKFIPNEKLRNETIKRVMNNLTERLKSRKGTTVEDLAEDESVLADILKNVGAPIEVFNNLLKQSNDILETVNNGMKEWVSSLSAATEMKIDAQNISIEAGNQLSRVLGDELSLGDMNQAFENTINTLTQRIGANGAGIPGTGTLDPGTIMQRMLEREQESRDIQEQLRKEKPPIGSARFNELSESLRRAQLEATNLSKAHQKLQNDSSRAANALTKIGELRQVQENRQGGLLDLLKDINNPEAMMQFTREVESFFAQMAGEGTMQNLPMAIAGLERQMALLPREQAQALQRDFIRSIREPFANARDANGNFRFNNRDLEMLDSIIDNVTGVSPEMEGLIKQFNEFTTIQKNATLEAADLLVRGATVAGDALTDAAVVAAGTISRAGQDNPRGVIPAQPRSKGGMIYASKGQYVNFQPRGTDTVPAMLTPGEFVVNAKATKQNRGLLESINSNKIGGYSKGGVVYLEKGGYVAVDKTIDSDYQDIVEKMRAFDTETESLLFPVVKERQRLTGTINELSARLQQAENEQQKSQIQSAIDAATSQWQQIDQQANDIETNRNATKKADFDPLLAAINSRREAENMRRIAQTGELSDADKNTLAATDTGPVDVSGERQKRREAELLEKAKKFKEKEDKDKQNQALISAMQESQAQRDRVGQIASSRGVSTERAVRLYGMEQQRQALQERVQQERQRKREEFLSRNPRYRKKAEEKLNREQKEKDEAREWYLRSNTNPDGSWGGDVKANGGRDIPEDVLAQYRRNKAQERSQQNRERLLFGSPVNPKDPEAKAKQEQAKQLTKEELAEQARIRRGEELARKFGWSLSDTKPSGTVVGQYSGYERGEEPFELRRLSAEDQKALDDFQMNRLTAMERAEREKTQAAAKKASEEQWEQTKIQIAAKAAEERKIKEAEELKRKEEINASVAAKMEELRVQQAERDKAWYSEKASKKMADSMYEEHYRRARETQIEERRKATSANREEQTDRIQDMVTTVAIPQVDEKRVRQLFDEPEITTPDQRTNIPETTGLDVRIDPITGRPIDTRLDPRVLSGQLNQTLADLERLRVEQHFNNETSSTASIEQMLQDEYAAAMAEIDRRKKQGEFGGRKGGEAERQARAEASKKTRLGQFYSEQGGSLFAGPEDYASKYVDSMSTQEKEQLRKERREQLAEQQKALKEQGRTTAVQLAESKKAQAAELERKKTRIAETETEFQDLKKKAARGRLSSWERDLLAEMAVERGPKVAKDVNLFGGDLTAAEDNIRRRSLSEQEFVAARRREQKEYMEQVARDRDALAMRTLMPGSNLVQLGGAGIAYGAGAIGGYDVNLTDEDLTSGFMGYAGLPLDLALPIGGPGRAAAKAAGFAGTAKGASLLSGPGLGGARKLAELPGKAVGKVVQAFRESDKAAEAAWQRYSAQLAKQEAAEAADRAAIAMQGGRSMGAQGRVSARSLKSGKAALEQGKVMAAAREETLAITQQRLSRESQNASEIVDNLVNSGLMTREAAQQQAEILAKQGYAVSGDRIVQLPTPKPNIPSVSTAEKVKEAVQTTTRPAPVTSASKPSTGTTTRMDPRFGGRSLMEEAESASTNIVFKDLPPGSAAAQEAVERRAAAAQRQAQQKLQEEAAEAQEKLAEAQKVAAEKAEKAKPKSFRLSGGRRSKRAAAAAEQARLDAEKASLEARLSLLEQTEFAPARTPQVSAKPKVSGKGKASIDPMEGKKTPAQMRAEAAAEADRIRMSGQTKVGGSKTTQSSKPPALPTRQQPSPPPLKPPVKATQPKSTVDPEIAEEARRILTLENKRFASTLSEEKKLKLAEQIAESRRGMVDRKGRSLGLSPEEAGNRSRKQYTPAEQRELSDKQKTFKAIESAEDEAEVARLQREYVDNERKRMDSRGFKNLDSPIPPERTIPLPPKRPKPQVSSRSTEDILREDYLFTNRGGGPDDDFISWIGGADKSRLERIRPRGEALESLIERQMQELADIDKTIAESMGKVPQGSIDDLLIGRGMAQQSLDDMMKGEYISVGGQNLRRKPPATAMTPSPVKPATSQAGKAFGTKTTQYKPSLEELTRVKQQLNEAIPSDTRLSRESSTWVGKRGTPELGLGPSQVTGFKGSIQPAGSNLEEYTANSLKIQKWLYENAPGQFKSYEDFFRFYAPTGGRSEISALAKRMEQELAGSYNTGFKYVNDEGILSEEFASGISGRFDLSTGSKEVQDKLMGISPIGSRKTIDAGVDTKTMGIIKRDLDDISPTASSEGRRYQTYGRGLSEFVQSRATAMRGKLSKLTPGSDAYDSLAKKLAEEEDRIRLKVAEIIPEYRKFGGLIYASKGTLVPYQPRGTDTVPAMLTPGEFVVNRKAAKQNMGLLKAINNGHNVQPLGFNKGGIVPTQYYQTGSNGPVSGGSSSGGGVSNISVDASALDAAFSNFNSYVSSLSSVIDGFTQGTTELAGLSQAIGALGSLGLREGASLMANAGTSVKDATQSFSSAMIEFNTAATSLAAAISSIPQSISLTVSGSIPVTVSVQIEGGTGTGTDTSAIEQSIMDQVALAINSATQGGITIDTAIA